MDIPEDKPIIEVLGKSASCNYLNAESGENLATVSGKASFKLIYRTEGGAHALDYFSSFSTDIKLNGKSNIDKLLAFSKVLSVDIISQKDREIKLKAVIEIELLGIIKNEYELKDNLALCRKTEILEQIYLKDIASGTFDIYEEFESGANVDNVLLLDGDLMLSSSKTGRDCLLVSGTVSVNMVYSTDKGIASKTLSMPFCEEVAERDAHPDHEVYLYGAVKDLRIVLSGDEDNTVIRVEVTVSLTCPVFEKSEVEVLNDAFDIENDVTLTKKEYLLCKKVGEWNFEERLSGSAKLGDDNVYATKIVTASIAKNMPSAVKVERDKISLEGTANATVIYEDDEGALKSVEVELPYALDLKADGVKTGGDIYTQSAICDVTAAIKRGKEIEVMYLLRVNVCECERIEKEIVTDIKLAEASQSEMPALVMYMGGADEDDFEVAKSLRVKPENVIRGEDKEFVLCYRQLDI